MPVALVEIGFMTNQEELDKLKSDEYQEAAAKALCTGCAPDIGGVRP